MNFNRNYGKLNESGTLIYAPNPLVTDNENVWTNKADTFLKCGYFPIERTKQPIKDGYYYTAYYVLDSDVITQKWEEHEETAEPSTEAEELLDIVGGEIAI